MKNPVDSLFNLNIKSKYQTIKDKMQKNYAEIIKRIECYENECLAKQETSDKSKS